MQPSARPTKTSYVAGSCNCCEVRGAGSEQRELSHEGFCVTSQACSIEPYTLLQRRQAVQTFTMRGCLLPSGA